MSSGGPGGFRVADVPVPALEVRGAVVRAANDLVCDEIGIDAARLVDRPLVDLVVPSDRRGLTKALDQCFASGAVEQVDVSFRADGGATRPVELSVRAAGDDVAVVTVRNAMRDRTMHALLDALADSTLVIDASGRVTWQSDALAHRLSDRVGNGFGVNPIERVHPEDLPMVLDSFARGVSTPGLRDHYVVRSRSPEHDDQWEMIEVSGVSAIDNPDIAGVVVQIRNLGDREVLGSVSRTEGEYQSLTDAAPIGIVVDDVLGNTVYRNPTAQELLGPGSHLHSGVAWREAAHVEYQAVLEAMMSAALERRSVGNTIAAFGPKDEPSRWLRVKVAPQLSDGEGGVSVVGVITTLEDVTSEVEARAETERLTHMLDATSDYVAVFRPTGEILYLNETARAALERMAAAGASGRLTDLISDRVRSSFFGEVLSVLEDSNIWRGELTLQVSPDRQVPVSALAVARRDRDGELEWIAMLARDISELKEAETRLRQLATRDALTGLANRSLANDRLEQAVARHRRKGHGLAVLFCDLDGFKGVNDEYGHAAGDRVLVEVSRRLVSVTRASDTVARVGGDEFVVVCEGLTDRQRLAELAQRVIGVVSTPVELEVGERVAVGISVGVAVSDGTEGPVDADRLLTRADTAMYRVKAHGGNDYRIVSTGG